MRIIYAAVIFSLCLLACNSNEQKNTASILNPSNLSSESFSIDITRDTVLLSKKGAVIKIPKGSLTSSDGKSASLLIKEAYSIEDMLRAGLTTTSKGVALSSGGMIYIGTGIPSKEKINGPISVAIPTSSINREMQLYRGKEDSGTIDWVEPAPLPPSPQTLALDKGEQLFKTNCASCHAIGKDLIGRDLAHIVKRSKKIAEKEGHNFLYEFTLNYSRVIPLSNYYRIATCSRNVAMNVYEGALTNKDLDNLYSFIENESETRNLPVPNFEVCVDSCIDYVRTLDSLAGRLQDLAVPMPMVIEKGMDGVNRKIIPDNAIIVDTLVSPLEHQSMYYQFTVSNSGWFNIDMLLNQGYNKNVLICSPKQTEYTRVNYYLVVPSLRAVIPGGPIKQEGRIGFFSINGTIPLPLGIKAYIIALGEFEDKIVYSKIEFEVERRQDFEIDLQFISKEEFNNTMASLNFNEISIVANDTENANQIRSTIKSIKEAQILKPKNCKCDCDLYFESVENM